MHCPSQVCYKIHCYSHCGERLTYFDPQKNFDADTQPLV
ncbi:unnamed protein product, partial [Vitis vinifera]|uniref:Uncharacterized protein n=1 Tax=Vitis vinifera TaxID=29760 RepID=D7SUS8_VITVI